MTTTVTKDNLGERRADFISVPVSQFVSEGHQDRKSRQDSEAESVEERSLMSHSLAGSLVHA